MPEISARPLLNELEIPSDAWSQPFWDGTAQHKLVLPRCADCGRYRWPPGPFCPACHSQRVEWVPAGEGRVYSFTVIPGKPPAEGSARRPTYVPGLIEFPDASGLRLLAAIVDTPTEAVRIGAKVELSWSKAANVTVPVFKVIGDQ